MKLNLIALTSYLQRSAALLAIVISVDVAGFLGASPLAAGVEPESATDAKTMNTSQLDTEKESIWRGTLNSMHLYL